MESLLTIKQLKYLNLELELEHNLANNINPGQETPTGKYTHRKINMAIVDFLNQRSKELLKICRH